MGDISAIIAAILSAILSAIGTSYLQKRRNMSASKKNALYMYLNLKQIKENIDRDKKIVDAVDNANIILTPYFTPYDYIAFLCSLNDKLSEEEISKVNEFYENVKKLDNYKMIFSNVLGNYNNYYSMYPQMVNIYQEQYNMSFNNFKNTLNSITNSDLYKDDIVKIITKLKEIKNK